MRRAGQFGHARQMAIVDTNDSPAEGGKVGFDELRCPWLLKAALGFAYGQELTKRGTRAENFAGLRPAIALGCSGKQIEYGTRNVECSFPQVTRCSCCNAQNGQDVVRFQCRPDPPPDRLSPIGDVNAYPQSHRFAYECQAA